MRQPAIWRSDIGEELMGVMRFTVHPEGLLDSDRDLSEAYLSGFDGRVFPSRVECDGQTIELRRMNSESGKLHVPWNVPGVGRSMVSTATLREHDTAYILALELARGKICQVRNQLAAWQALGMAIPDTFLAIHREAHRLFAKATATKSDVAASSELASQAVDKACRAADILARSYVEQRLRVRFKRTPQLPVSFGCGLNAPDSVEKFGDAFKESFNAAAIPIEWKQIEKQEGEHEWDDCDKLIEWCHDQKLLLRAGPLLDLSENGLPAWLHQWGQDFFNLQSFLCDFVETAISRYAGKIRIWEVSTRVNTGGAFNLTEEERLTLVAKTIEVARTGDEEAQLFIRVEDPWGSYQSGGQHRLSPIQFVDALVRCGIGLSGVNLEIPVGYSSCAGTGRDLLDLSRLIDQWSMLELPLHVTLAVAGSSAGNSNATGELTVRSQAADSEWTAEEQNSWIDRYVPLLMAKQAVIGIYWSHLTDQTPHVFSNAGLIDAQGIQRVGLQSFMKHRTGKTYDDLGSTE